jgi:flagellar hook-associated protein 1 FlgK
LNTYATALAQVANSSIPETDENGAATSTYKTLLAAKDSEGKATSTTGITAANISISDTWTKEGAGYFIFSTKESVTKYAQQLCTNLTENSHTFQSFGESFSGTFTDFEVDFLAKLGSDLGYQTGRQNATAAISNALEDSRDEISGVNRDEETTDMLKYQKSYEAAARVMTTLDDMLDVLINKMGRVGL